MHWLFIGLATIVERLVTWLITKGIKQGAYFLGYVSFVVGLFTAFLAATYIGLMALKPITPNGVGFALAFLPPSTAWYMSFYLTVLISKRVYDWHKHLSRDFTQATMRF
ncbi:hypothetical protein LG201_13030 [Methylobacillus gramineus]|uniref:hypothetical protein n=1 Tax=Methylobacillus gramineus TaxID=755169 RepID=UPI001CFF83FF|nr:hypothetical protein [Methylobacillus gramineus]MCB5186131.1 hypothetical protein [Methylobacillus gramineus]